MMVRVIRPLIGFLVLAALIVALPLFRAPTRAMGGTDLFLDPTFGGQGMALPDVPSMTEVRALHLLPDGSLLSAGPVSPLGGTRYDFAVLKLRPDGALDPSFGDGGLAAVNVAIPGEHNDAATSMVVDSQGRILLAGTYSAGNNISKIGFVRFLPDGTLDPAFADGGVARTNAELTYSQPYAALQPDGKIVVGAGSTGPNSVLARFMADGLTLDPDFGDGGFLIEYGNGIGDVAVEPNGAIVTGGTHDGGMAFTRYHPDGTFDSTFGTLGRVVITPPNPEHFALGTTLIRLPNGGWLLSGHIREESYEGPVAGMLAQITPSGAPDPAFGTGGVAVLDRSEGREGFVGAARGEDGRITTGSLAGNYSPPREPYVARFLANGTLDPAFGEAGVVAFSFEDFDPSRGVAAYGDGRVVVGGTFERGALRRFLPDGRPDRSFGYRGYTLFGGIRPRGHAQTVRLPDGKWMTFSGWVAMRLGPDGSPDEGFGSGGWKAITMPHYGDYITYAALDDNQGRPVVLNHANVSWVVTRHDGAGDLDPSFGSSGVVSETVSPSYVPPTILLETAENRLVMGGHYPNYTNQQGEVWLFRYLENGQRDPTFGGDGKVELTGCGLSYPSSASAVTHADGRLTVGGICGSGGRVWRLNADGTLDPTFGAGGSIAVTRPRVPRALAEDTSGRVYVMGSTQQVGNFAAEILRLQSDGSPDPAWGENGVAAFPLPDSFIFPVRMLEDGDGRFYVVGHVEILTEPTSVFVARLLPNGVVDTGFGQGGLATMLLTEYDLPLDVDWDGEALRVTARALLGDNTGYWPILGWFRYVVADIPSPTATATAPTSTPTPTPSATGTATPQETSRLYLPLVTNRAQARQVGR